MENIKGGSNPAHSVEELESRQRIEPDQKDKGQQPAGSSTDEVSTLRSKLQNVIQEKDQAVASLVQLEANRIDDGKQITSYQGRLQDLQQRYDEETSRMRQERSITKNCIAQLVQERDQVVADLSGLEKKHESELYQLQIHNQQLSDLKKKMESEVGRLQQENQRVNRDLSLVTQEKKKVMADLANLEVRSRTDAKQMETYKQQLHDLQQRSIGGSGSHVAIIRRKDEEINKLTMLLSKYMNRRLGADESALENIYSKNWPSKIVEDYTELMTTLWLDAKDQLDEAYPDDESEEGKLRCLSSIVLLAREVAESRLGQYRAYVQQVLSHPLTHLSGGNQHQQTSMENHQLDEFNEVVLGSVLKSTLTNFLKTCSDGVNSEALTQRFNASMHRLLTKVKRHKDDGLAQYTAATCVFAWRLAIQRPPITLEIPNMGGPVDKNLHEVYFSCPKHDSNVISTYVWPMLKQKGKNLAKAKVFVVPKYIYDKGMQH